MAHESGYVRSLVDGDEFQHVVYETPYRGPGGTLHVYLDGDGRPYLNRWTVAPDPTPWDPLMLRLMALDGGDAIYVGRPCYFGQATQPPCNSFDWTLGRFSERVLASLAAVIESQSNARRVDAVELYGHSGGGALAVLLGHRLPNVTRIVTIGANLDPDAWAQLHRYSPLAGSQNPVRLGPLPARIVQRHYAGAKDKVVPYWMIERAARQIGADALVIPGMSHLCCWQQLWPAILADQALEPSLRD